MSEQPKRSVREVLASVARQLLLVGLALFAVQLYQTRSHPGGAAPEISARLLTGEPIKLGGAGAEPVALHFWASWCGVCKLEEGNVASLAEGGRVITVASRSGSAANVQAYMRARGLSFPVVLDESGAIAARYGVRAYPSTFFVDRAGGIDASVVGYTTTLGFKLRLWLAGL
jgi:thiol-disulfide isomerase/thioredoxin